MLTKEDVENFIDGLEFAGLRPYKFTDAFREGLVASLLERFSYASPQELQQAGAILQEGDKWPTFHEIEEAINQVHKTDSSLVDAVLTADAYPEGEDWAEWTQQQAQQMFPEQTEWSRLSIANLHWYLGVQKQCQRCQGQACAYSGHRPGLKLSDNGTELNLCVQGQLCTKYKVQQA